jgi:hypothetical protein
LFENFADEGIMGFSNQRNRNDLRIDNEKGHNKSLQQRGEDNDKNFTQHQQLPPKK